VAADYLKAGVEIAGGNGKWRWKKRDSLINGRVFLTHNDYSSSQQGEGEIDSGCP